MTEFNLKHIIDSFPDLKFRALDEKFIKEILPERNLNASKHDFGHALLLVGSEDKTGAAILATKACLRSGAGLTTVHIPHSCKLALNISCPETMLRLDSNGMYISQVPDVEYKTAIGLGPGIGINPETAKVVHHILENDLPKVIDADGLNLLAENPIWFSHLDEKCILTPHAKEFDRLTKVHSTWQERFTSAKEFATTYGCVLVLKAPQTLIFSPKGEVFYNTTGNVALAKGGSGDVLTGIITAYLAQGIPALEAALCGVFNHGLAANLAVKEINPRALLASDLVEYLTKI